MKKNYVDKKHKFFSIYFEEIDAELNKFHDILLIEKKVKFNLNKLN